MPFTREQYMESLFDAKCKNTLKLCRPLHRLLLLRLRKLLELAAFLTECIHTPPPALKILFSSKSLLFPQMSFYRVFFFKWASSENVSKLIGCSLLSTCVYHEQANIGQIQYRVCQNCRRVVMWLLKTLSKRAAIQQKRFQRAEWPVWGDGEEK